MEETEAKECIVTCYCRGTKWSIVNQEIQNLEIMKSVVKNSHFGEVSVTYDLYEIHMFLSKSGGGVKCSGRRLVRAHCVLLLT